MPRPFPSALFHFHYPIISLTFDDILSEALEESLNKTEVSTIKFVPIYSYKNE
jgi:hypothetical protein